MRQIVPFRDRFELQKAIDNGGRFYNFFSKAGDSVVTKAELAKAAGVVCANLNAVLFLDFAKSHLDKLDQAWILDLLEPKLREYYETHQPKHWRPSELDDESEPGSAVVITGYCRFLQDHTQINGFTMIPIYVGTVMTFVTIPLQQQFDLYQVFDDEDMQSPNCLVAVEKDLLFDQNGPVRIGGVLRELKVKEGEPSHPYFLEAMFYTDAKSENR